MMKNSIAWALASTLALSCGQKTEDPTARDDAPAGVVAQDVSPAQAPTSAKDPPKKDASKILRSEVPLEGLPLLGAADAKVTLVEMTDYECPYCARAEATVQTLRQSYGRELRVFVAESPLPMHERADELATFALLASEAGVFEQAHTQLFAEPRRHTDEDLSALGAKLGMGGFMRSPASQALAKKNLDKSQALARSVHANGTPTFFVNGRIISGAQPIETFRTMIDEELTHANELMESGVARRELYSAFMQEARKNPRPPGDAETPEETYVPDAVGVGGLPLAGDKGAHHTIVVFTDLECPFCARLDGQLRGFVESHPDVKVVVRQRPLAMHTNARTWALAAIAADAQGKLSVFMENAFAERSDRSAAALDRVARESGLNVERLRRDMASASTLEALRADEALADKLGARGTPTSFLDGHRVVGAQPNALFEEALKKAAIKR